jgi:N-acyl-D-amino-acid deacylase
MEEAFLIGRECASMEGAALPVVLSHHKVTGKAHWGQTKRTLSRFDEASRLQPLALDVYPYDASSTVLKMDAARRSSKVVVTWSKAMPEAAGRTLAELAQNHFCCGEEEAAAQLQPAGAVYFAMDENDVRRVLCHPCAMVGSE